MKERYRRSRAAPSAAPDLLCFHFVHPVLELSCAGAKPAIFLLPISSIPIHNACARRTDIEQRAVKPGHCSSCRYVIFTLSCGLRSPLSPHHPLRQRHPLIIRISHPLKLRSKPKKYNSPANVGRVAISTFVPSGARSALNLTNSSPATSTAPG